MTEDWIKLRVTLQTHPKVFAIASALCPQNFRKCSNKNPKCVRETSGVGPEIIHEASNTRPNKFEVIGGLHAVWSVFDTHSIDGRLVGYTSDALDVAIGWPGFAQAMIAVGWLHEDGLQALVLPEFGAHNGQSAKRRAEDRKRKAIGPRPEKLRTECGLEREEEIEKEKEEKKEQAHAVRAPSAPRKNRAVPALTYIPPAGIDRQLWGEFVVMRARIRHPLTEETAARIGRKLARIAQAGQDANESLERAVIREYRDVFPIDRPAANGSGHPPDDDPFKGAI